MVDFFCFFYSPTGNIKCYDSIYNSLLWQDLNRSRLCTVKWRVCLHDCVGICFKLVNWSQAFSLFLSFMLECPLRLGMVHSAWLSPSFSFRRAKKKQVKNKNMWCKWAPCFGSSRWCSEARRAQSQCYRHTRLTQWKLRINLCKAAQDRLDGCKNRPGWA